MDGSGKYRAPALDKGLDILELLAVSPSSMGQAEIAKELGRTPNELYRMLDTLISRHYVTRSPEGDRYMLSLKLLELAHRNPPHRRVLDIAEPLISALCIESGQSAHLVQWEDGDVVIVASFSAPGNWRQSLRTGSVVGLYNTGSGRVLVAFQKSDRRLEMIRDHRLVPGEIEIDQRDFLAEMDTIKSMGFLVEPSGTVRGTTNISFPILGPNGTAIAALTCPYIERIDGYPAPDIDEVTNIVGAAARELGRQIAGA
ncbi:MAG: IclR family transcriptional regulator [Pseudomonadota bacterium]